VDVAHLEAIEAVVEGEMEADEGEGGPDRRSRSAGMLGAVRIDRQLGYRPSATRSWSSRPVTSPYSCQQPSDAFRRVSLDTLVPGSATPSGQAAGIAGRRGPRRSAQFGH
jgi:hypothetical protein